MHTGIQYNNNASTQLSEVCLASDTVLTVGDNATSIFPKINNTGDYFTLTLSDVLGNTEVVICTEKTDNTFTVIRGQEGTTASYFPVGTLVENRLTASGLTNLVNDASTVKYHVSANADTYGKATANLYSHAKVSDNFESGLQAIHGAVLSPEGFNAAILRLLAVPSVVTFTTSGTWTVPETGKYVITAVGAGGKGGKGGTGYYNCVVPYEGECWCDSGGGGGGGGGGGAGETVVNTVSLTKGTVITITIGAPNGGITTFGSLVTARGGGTGNPGGTAPNGGPGGSGGLTYGTAGATGQKGFSVGNGGHNAEGGAGGIGGNSTYGTYGTGGTGGTGGQGIAVNNNAACYNASTGGAAGANGVQGFLKIQRTW